MCVKKSTFILYKQKLRYTIEHVRAMTSLPFVVYHAVKLKLYVKALYRFSLIQSYSSVLF